eukprot:symbB.v1.2.021281.t1/scaffold1831.1/size99527/4
MASIAAFLVFTATGVAALPEETSLLQFPTSHRNTTVLDVLGNSRPDVGVASHHSMASALPLSIFDSTATQSWVMAEVSSNVETASQTGDKKTWTMTIGMVVLILLAISPICMNEGGGVLFLVVSYIASLTSVKLFVKEAIEQGFPYPETITAVHMLGVCLVTGCITQPELKEAFSVLPISLLHGASLMANNTALLFGGVAFVSMIASNVPFIVFLLEIGKRKRGIDLTSISAVTLVCCGSIFCVYGEPAASISAFILALASSIFGAMRAVWQHELVVISISPLHMVFWNGFWSLCISVALMVSNERLKAFTSLPDANLNAKMALLGSIAMAVTLNITQWYVVKRPPKRQGSFRDIYFYIVSYIRSELGPLMQTMIGNLNLVLVMALSSAYLQEQVTLVQYIGVLLLSVGTFWNKAQDVIQKERFIGKQRGGG